MSPAPLIRPLISPLNPTVMDATSNSNFTPSPPDDDGSNAQLDLSSAGRSGFNFFYGTM